MPVEVALVIAPACERGGAHSGADRTEDRFA